MVCCLARELAGKPSKLAAPVEKPVSTQVKRDYGIGVHRDDVGATCNKRIVRAANRFGGFEKRQRRPFRLAEWSTGLLELLTHPSIENDKIWILMTNHLGQYRRPVVQSRSVVSAIA